MTATAEFYATALAVILSYLEIKLPRTGEDFISFSSVRLTFKYDV